MLAFEENKKRAWRKTKLSMEGNKAKHEGKQKLNVL